MLMRCPSALKLGCLYKLRVVTLTNCRRLGTVYRAEALQLCVMLQYKAFSLLVLKALVWCLQGRLSSCLLDPCRQLH
jgi:hypothetical protein